MDAFDGMVNPFLTDMRAPPVIIHPLVTRENIVMTAALRTQLPLRTVYETLLPISARYNSQRPRVLVQTSLGTANIYQRSVVITGAHDIDGGHLLLQTILLILMRHDTNAYQPMEVRYASMIENPLTNLFGKTQSGVSSSPPMSGAIPTAATAAAAASSSNAPLAIFDRLPIAPSSEFAYNVRLQNMVGCVRTGHHMADLWTMKNHVLTDASYEPNVFPGLMTKKHLTRPDGKKIRVAVTFHTSGSAIITGAACDWDLWNAAAWACAQIWETHKKMELMHSENSQWRVLVANGFFSLTSQLSEARRIEHQEVFGENASVTPPPPLPQACSSTPSLGSSATAVNPRSKLRTSASILQEYGHANTNATASDRRTLSSSMNTATTSYRANQNRHHNQQHHNAHVKTVLSDADLDTVSSTVAMINARLQKLALHSSRSASPSPSGAASPLRSSPSRSPTPVTSVSAPGSRIATTMASISLPDQVIASGTVQMSYVMSSSSSPSPSTTSTSPSPVKRTAAAANDTVDKIVSPPKRSVTQTQLTGYVHKH